MTRTGLLLAAGLSRRFGEADKLLAELDGRPLVDHAAAVLAGCDLDRLVAVVSSEAVAERLRPIGYDLLFNPEPETGMGHSLALASSHILSNPRPDPPSSIDPQLRSFRAKSRNPASPSEHAFLDYARNERIENENGSDEFLLVVLADMPRITSDHLTRLIEAPGPIAASGARGILSPPARFAESLIPTLATLTGETGARALLAKATPMDTDPAILADVDTPEMLSRLSHPPSA